MKTSNSPFRFFSILFIALSCYIASSTITYYFFSGVFPQIHIFIIILLSFALVGFMYWLGTEYHISIYSYFVLAILFSISISSSVGGIKQKLNQDIKTEANYDKTNEIIDMNIKTAKQADELIDDRRKLADSKKNIWFKYNNLEKAEQTLNSQINLMANTVIMPVDSLNLSGFYLLSKDLSDALGTDYMLTQLIFLVLIAIALDLTGSLSWRKLALDTVNSGYRGKKHFNWFNRGKNGFMDFESYAIKLWQNVPHKHWRDKSLYSSEKIPIKRRLEKRYRDILVKEGLIKVIGTTSYAICDFQTYMAKVNNIGKDLSRNVQKP